MVNFAIGADRLESRRDEKTRSNDKSCQANPATRSQVCHAAARGFAFVPDGVVGYSFVNHSTLVFIAACARDRRGKSKWKKAQAVKSGRTCARDRSSTISRRVHIHAGVLEARGCPASLSAAQRNQHTHHLWRTQRSRWHGCGSCVARGLWTTDPRERSARIRGDVPVSLKRSVRSSSRDALARIKIGHISPIGPI